MREPWPRQLVQHVCAVADTVAARASARCMRRKRHVYGGGGPSFLELKTYRYRGHSMSDAQHYRTKEEVEQYKKIDPITKVKEILLSKKYATQNEIDAIDLGVKERVADCEKFAEESPYPEKQVMYDAVYEQTDYPFLKHKL